MAQATKTTSTMAASLDESRMAKAAAVVRRPAETDRVYKEECMFSMYGPYSRDGAFVNLATWHCFSPEFVARDMARHAAGRGGGVRVNPEPPVLGVYLHELWRKVKKPKEEDTGEGGGTGESSPADADGEPDAKRPRPTRLALGVKGGIDVDAETTVKKHAVVVFLGDAAPDASTPFEALERVSIELPDGFGEKPDDELEGALPALHPDILEVARLVIAHADALRHDSAKSTAESWDAVAERRVSRYAADLEQLDSTGKKIPPSGWKCESSGQTENLWLNLSTGYIGSGRRNWDGSGGTGAALAHFEETGSKYPLVVKLGTISAEGADVYSYAPDEDDMVIDPKLKEHLLHWGIDMDAMSKTDKTMEEMEIDYNMTFDFDSGVEDGVSMETLAGPGLVGLENIGNSCYFNSLMQSLLAIPEFSGRYLTTAEANFAAAPLDPSQDLRVQFSKLAIATRTEKYVAEPAQVEPLVEGESADASGGDGDATAVGGSGGAEGDGTKGVVVCPRMLKILAGKGNAEFETNRQQDTQEYFLHLLNKLERDERLAGRRGADDVTSLFGFMFETRTECAISHKVSYTDTPDQLWSLPVPVEAATNAAAVEAYEKAREEWKAAPKSTRGKEPDIVRLNIPFDALITRYFADSNIDGYFSAATGANGPAVKRQRFKTFPKILVMHLQKYVLGEDWRPKKLDTSITFPEELDLEAYRGTGLVDGEEPQPGAGGAASVEPDATIVAAVAAMGFSENAGKRAALATSNAGPEEAVNWVMGHMDDPDLNDPPADAGGSSGATDGVDPTALMMLTSMGISEKHAAKAIRETGGDLERAAEWAFSHEERDEPDLADVPSGPGRYTLFAVVSHQGGNTGSGHYVAHVKVDGRWVLFNDRKVSASVAPRLDLGYMYFWRRVD